MKPLLLTALLAFAAPAAARQAGNDPPAPDPPLPETPLPETPLPEAPPHAEGPGDTTELRLGPWRAWLDSPGGELPFGLELARDDEAHRAWIVNGTERIAVPRVTLEGGELGLHMDHYDSRVTATIAPGGGRLDGTWEKRRGPDEWTRMAFHAVAGDLPRFPVTGDYGLPGLTDEELAELGYTGVLEGSEEQRWEVRFSSSDDPAVLELRRVEPGLVMGTFLTTTGDYRYLAGRLGLDGLWLSCFDGAHAFLFHARLEWPGLKGEFWSRDTWHETWTAEWSPHAALPSPYAQTTWMPGTSLTPLAFPDLDGEVRSLGDPDFAGTARILQVFGSWCPNCHDEAPLLVELHDAYAEKGLSIVGLAFELTGDPERDAEQVRRYARRHGVEFPLLLAGPADKEDATAALGALDRVRSFPTTIFLRSDGSIVKIHTGFTGPGTGEEYTELRRDFIETIEGLLAEGPVDDAPHWRWLASSPFYLREAFGGAKLEFRREGGKPVVERTRYDRSGEAEVEVLPVEMNYEAVRFGGELWAIDRATRVLQDPLDFGRRLSPDPRSTTPLLGKRKIAIEEEALLAALEQPSVLVQREALVALAELRAAASEKGLPEALGWLGEDTELPLRLTAAWAVGRTFERAADDALVACLGHPFAPLRREAARSLARMSPHLRDLRERLAPRPPDPDPLVRRAIDAALR